MSLHLLGQPQIVYNQRDITHDLPTKAQAILIYLAVTGQPQTRLWLASLLWPDVAESRALKNLRDILPTLRQQLADCLLITRKTVALDPELAYELDVAQFVQLPQATLTEDQRHEMVNLYRGEFLSGFYVPQAEPFAEWQMMWRERLHELALTQMDELVAQMLPQPALWQMGLALTQRVLALEPWRESAHRQRMLLLAFMGQRNTAVAQYALCRQTLADEFGIEPTQQTQTLYAQIMAGEVGPPDPPPPAVPVPSASPRTQQAAYLPRPLTPFFGRQEELSRVVSQLRNHHYPLVTIMGEGGIGKTRLALAAAHKVAADFTGGVWFVSLEHLPHTTDAQMATEHLVGAIEDVLDTAVGYPSKATATNLYQLIGERQILLVLDNMEHLTASKKFLLDLLTNCPHLSLLITTRERLNVQAEMVVRLHGLPVPSDTQPLQMPELITVSSLQLFTERASRLTPNFMLDEHNLPYVVRICQLVEGLPLAIEMAAALTAYQSCAAIWAAVQDNYNALTVLEPDDLPSRQQSLQAVFDYSWARLAPEEGLALAQCALFQGGFTAAAATAVAQVPVVQLHALTQKSLLRTSGHGRFHMHELVRHFAATKLPTLPIDSAAVQRKHAHYYAQFVQQRTHLLENDTAVLREIQAEMGNIRAAWQWATAQHQLAVLSEAHPGLMSFYRLTGSFREAYALLKETLQQLAAFPTTAVVRLLQGQLALAQSYFVQRILNLHEAVQLAQTGIRIGQELDNAPLQISGHVRLAAIRFDEGQIGESEKQSQLGLALARQHDILPLEQAQAVRYLGQIATMHGDYEAARAYYQESLTIARQIGHRPHEGIVLKDLGIIEWRHGAYDRARDYLQAGLSNVQATGNRPTEAEILKNLGIVAWFLGQYEQAANYYESSLALYQDIGDQTGASDTLNNLGLLAWGQGDYTQSATYYQQSLHIKEQIGDRLQMGIIMGNLGIMSRTQGQYEQARQWHLQSLSIVQDVGDELGRGRTLNNLGLVAANLGQYEQAIAYYNESLAIRRALADQEGQGKTLHNLGAVAYMQGQYATAVAYHEEGRLICQSIGDQLGESVALTGLGLAWLGAGELARAEAVLPTAVVLRRNLNNTNLLMESLTTLAALRLTQNKPDDALAILEEVLTHLAQGGNFVGTEYNLLNYWHSYQILAATNDERQHAFLSTAVGQLHRQIDQIQSADLKHSFCHNIPWHQALLREPQK
ncbi:MAG: tetratricopeptide repeat protein [Anaerolineales bacterium]|nr:tetratricopeptide repeat protein [Anaerolineales bacterium]